MSELMKGFIELTYQEQYKYTFNVAQIVWFCPTTDGKRTILFLNAGKDGTQFIMSESYEQVKKLIAEAVAE